MAKNKILSKIGKFIKGLVEETEEQENEIETNVDIHAAVECLNTALNYLQIHPEEKKIRRLRILQIYFSSRLFHY